jgi:sec-independent protein translocase protein TatA
MNVFGIGLPEMILIFGLALLVFGPKKLPEIGKTLGKTIRGFQEASKEFEQEFKKEAERVETAAEAAAETPTAPPVAPPPAEIAPSPIEEPMRATLEPQAQLSPAADGE